MQRSLTIALLIGALVATGASAQPTPSDDAGEDGALPSWRPSPWRPHLDREPRALSSEAQCLALVRATRSRDLVHPQRVQVTELETPLDGVDWPVRLTSPILGVVVGAHGGHRRPRPLIGDCRLFAALAAWAPILRREGIARIGHLSLYRPEIRTSPREPSGHTRARAIDVAHFVFDDGTDLDVESGWRERTRGASPCGERAGEEAHMAAVRRAVCAASDGAMFNVILTPHYDDDHGNHVHLEVRTGMTGLVLH